MKRLLNERENKTNIQQIYLLANCITEYYTFGKHYTIFNVQNISTTKLNRMKSIFLIGFSVFSNALFSQDSAIENWQNKHPHVVAIESNTFHALSDEQKALLGENYIVFDHKLKLSDIEEFESNLALKTNGYTNHYEAKSEEANAIKAWLGKNQDVKIIPRSYFQSLNSDQQSDYIEADALICIGETITLEDIEIYEANH